MATAGRNNEAIEQVVMRLSIEDDVSTLSWSVVEAAITGRVTGQITIRLNSPRAPHNLRRAASMRCGTGVSFRS
jgi:hypothetical protein